MRELFVTIRNITDRNKETNKKGNFAKKAIEN